MINVISDKSKCCGCSACYSACPKKCISMVEDAEGFRYPIVDKSKCIDCGLCEKVCPVLNVSNPNKPASIFAFSNKSEDVRLKSSSGGAFSLLAEFVLSQDGVVFGAAYDNNWEVAHTYIERTEDLDMLRRSKYVQSRIGETYKQAKNFLKEGRKVLFTGTPCQISGLRHYLRKDYDNLLTMDFVCHSAPSPKVWRKYISEQYAHKGVAGKNSVFQSLKDMPSIKGINFRDKTQGWKKYSFSLSLTEASDEGEKNTVFRSPYYDNIFMNYFLSDTISRPSCYACHAKNGRSGADITVGDYWWINEIHPEFDDDKGCSVVYVFTDKGKQVFEKIKDRASVIETDSETDIKKAYLLEGAFAEHAIPNKTRSKFFAEFDNKSLEELRPLSIRVKTLQERMLDMIKLIVNMLGIFNVAKKIYKSIK